MKKKNPKRRETPSCAERKRFYALARCPWRDALDEMRASDGSAGKQAGAFADAVGVDALTARHSTARAPRAALMSVTGNNGVNSWISAHCDCKVHQNLGLYVVPISAFISASAWEGG